MSDPASGPKARRRAIRAAALPAEHGGWGFLLEPALLGLLLAPSWAAALLALAALAAFLTHQPLKLSLRDRHAGRDSERRNWADRFLLLYLLIAGASLAGALLLAGPALLLPLALALPLALTQLGHDLRAESRSLPAELAGAGALGALASMIAIAGGFDLLPALALWALLLVRSLPSVIYVRARLALEYGKSPDLSKVWISQALALTALLLLLAAGLAGWPALIGGLLLGLRAGLGLSEQRLRLRASGVGFRELAYGLLFVLFIALSHYFA